jgi:hypothetical protein
LCNVRYHIASILLYASVFGYTPVFSAIRKYSPLSASIPRYPQVFSAIRKYSPLSASIPRYLQLNPAHPQLNHQIPILSQQTP